MKDQTISPELTIHQAMKALNKARNKCLMVVDEKGRLLGTLTDGDLRRSILRGADFNATIGSSYYRNPTVLIEGQYTKTEAGKLIRERKHELLPVLDKERLVVNYLTWEQVFEDDIKREPTSINVPVVIMAGGKGTRLEPFTKVLPKPLLPIHEKPVIEHIIDRFIAVGVNDFHITVNYKGRILKAFFQELNPFYSVSFVDEQQPMGTAGSLKFFEGTFNDSFFVTNCDIIIEADYTDIYAFHNKYDFDITLVASAKEYIIPYGTCELNGDGYLANLKEKPKYSFLANSGLYVLNPEILKYIPENKMYNITDLIEDVKQHGMRAGVYPIGEDAWIDVGQWAEYKKAVDML